MASARFRTFALYIARRLAGLGFLFSLLLLALVVYSHFRNHKISWRLEPPPPSAPGLQVTSYGVSVWLFPGALSITFQRSELELESGPVSLSESEPTGLFQPARVSSLSPKWANRYRDWSGWFYRAAQSGPTTLGPATTLSNEALTLVGVTHGTTTQTTDIGMLSGAGTLPPQKMTTKSETFMFPLIYPALIALIPSALWLRRDGRKRRRATRLAHGLCPACGYDRRASPDACPECGSNETIPARP